MSLHLNAVCVFVEVFVNVYVCEKDGGVLLCLGNVKYLLIVKYFSFAM